MNKNVKIALIIGGTVLGVIVIVSFVLGAILEWPYRDWDRMGPGMMPGFGWMWLMPILWIAFLGLTVWAIVAAVRSSGESKGSDSTKAESAMEVLKKRYARGEINKEEYEQKKRDLA
jgi:putative membrane protein